ncbi:hypothetical protein [Bifidobacterium longum]|uniref:hypothetical protein n=1 Tax=Bifidobacterium longum TaxID=216816 RepID=UPI00117D43B4|nr:hypothetical protein [Bifidobacterium longum]
MKITECGIEILGLRASAGIRQWSDLTWVRASPSSETGCGGSCSLASLAEEIGGMTGSVIEAALGRGGCDAAGDCGTGGCGTGGCVG